MRLPILLAVALAVFLRRPVGREAHGKLAEEITRAITAVQQALNKGDLRTALIGLRRLERRWAKTEKTWALVTDYQEMDQVRLTIDRADQYLSAGGAAEARAELASLRFLVEHIPLKESLSLGSLF